MNREAEQEGREPGLYLVLISVHGLVRGHNMELGRDADTGGQIKYVVELARALAALPAVERVDLLTRQVHDAKVDADYGIFMEQLAPKAHIVRIPCGPRRYIRKEKLWPHLDSFVDHALQYVRRIGRVPDLIHGHYADAGYVAARLSGFLGVPMLFTGHSLGRVKRQRLIENGLSAQAVEQQYNISQRIEAEEIALDSAAMVVTSTHQEVEEQYSLYDNYHPQRMMVIPPGVDLSRFYPPKRGMQAPPIKAELDRFLTHPNKPMILALSRPDERKNISALVQAYGENSALRELANLVVVAGNRDDIHQLDRAGREVWSALLFQIDRYDLYGQIAYPKHHTANDVPDLYRLVAKQRGIFINPALTEPFGLTLIEAAASGLPIVATEDGGPRDIVRHCKNGTLIDPVNVDAMGNALRDALSDRAVWQRRARSGIAGANKYYCWSAHTERYMRQLQRKVLGTKRRVKTLVTGKSRLPLVDRLLITDIDDSLMPDTEALDTLFQRLKASGGHVGFGIATGRNINSVLRILKKWKIAVPDILVTSAGTEIHYGHWMIEDMTWQQLIDYRWDPEAIKDVLQGLPGLRLQPKSEQCHFKISYYIDPRKAPPRKEILAEMRHKDLHTNMVFSHGQFLDLIPIRASKGLALRYLAMKWGLSPDKMLVAGGSGNDEDMLRGNTLGVVVGNHQQELERLRGRPRIYFAEGEHAWGILEGMEHYQFLEQ